MNTHIYTHTEEYQPGHSSIVPKRIVTKMKIFTSFDITILMINSTQICILSVKFWFHKRKIQLICYTDYWKIMFYNIGFRSIKNSSWIIISVITLFFENEDMLVSHNMMHYLGLLVLCLSTGYIFEESITIIPTMKTCINQQRVMLQS